MYAVIAQCKASRNKGQKKPCLAFHWHLVTDLGTEIRHSLTPVQVYNTPTPNIHPATQTLSTSPYISVVLLISSIWPWMIRQVEAPHWNETHPFPLSVICCCNDLREDGEEKRSLLRWIPWTSQLCSGLMSWPASTLQALCVQGKGREVGQSVWDVNDAMCALTETDGQIDRCLLNDSKWMYDEIYPQVAKDREEPCFRALWKKV